MQQSYLDKMITLQLMTECHVKELMDHKRLILFDFLL